MKKFIEIILFVCLFSTIIQAKEVNRLVIEKVAINAFADLYNKDNSAVRVKEILAIKTDELSTTLYVVNINPTGFLIISASDATIPVLASSDKSNFSLERIPPQLEFLFNYYNKQIEKVEKQNIRSTPNIKKEWDKYSNSETTTTTTSILKSASTITFPLLSTTWNQNQGWNQYCPADASAPSGYGGHVPAGCGSVAMAQILYYWGCKVNESGSRTISSSYGNLYADFTEANYPWTNMSLNSSDEYNARLIYHCGIAVNTTYASNGSVTGTLNIMDAFQNYFGFKNTLAHEVSSSYTDPQWINLLKGQLDLGRPIFYDGSDDIEPYTSSHAWVIDGYNSSDQFHCNWGWGGSYNGYYSLNNLNPYLYLYTPSFAAIINLEPVMSTCDEVNGGNGVCASGSSFYVPNLPSGATVTWDKSSNITIASSQPSNPCIFQANGNGAGWVEATVNYNGQATLERKTVWVGLPHDITLYCEAGQGCKVGDTYPLWVSPYDYEYDSIVWGVYPGPAELIDLGHGYASIRFDAPGTYTMWANNVNECGSSAYSYVTNFLVYELLMSPNPASNEVEITISAGEAEGAKGANWSSDNAYSVTVLDIYGTVKIQKKYSGNKFTIPVSSLKDGNYFVKVSNDKLNSTKQLIIKH